MGVTGLDLARGCVDCALTCYGRRSNAHERNLAGCGNTKRSSSCAVNRRRPRWRARTRRKPSNTEHRRPRRPPRNMSRSDRPQRRRPHDGPFDRHASAVASMRSPTAVVLGMPTTLESATRRHRTRQARSEACEEIAASTPIAPPLHFTSYLGVQWAAKMPRMASSLKPGKLCTLHHQYGPQCPRRCRR